MQNQTNYGVSIAKFGGVEVLAFQTELAMPTVGEGQVLVENHFAAVNPVDFKTRMGLGWAAEKFKQHFPVILGFDFAGVVKQADPTTGLQTGDRVCALSFNGGAYSRYVVAEANLLAKIPDNISFAQAAALPTAGVTALQIIKQANLQVGQHIVLSAPLGGVGHLLLQLLKQHNVTVSVLCSTAKMAQARALGADNCFDYTDPASYPQLEADLFIDLVGGNAGVSALSMLKPQARVICVPTIYVPLLQQAGVERGLQVEKILVEPNACDLQHLLTQLSQQQIQLHIAHIFPIREIREAHQLLETGRVSGKILLDLTAN